MKFVTLKVNDSSAENAGRIEELLHDFLRMALEGWDLEKGGNFWNFEFANRQFKNGIGFLEQPNLGVKHSAIVLLRALLDVGGKWAAKRLLKAGVWTKSEQILMEVGNELSKLKAVQAAEKKLRTNAKQLSEEAKSNLKEKRDVLAQIEAVSELTQDTLRMLFDLFLHSCSSEEGISFETLMTTIEPMFAHPLSQVHSVMLTNIRAVQVDHSALFWENEAAFTKVVVYSFGLIKRRNFDFESLGLTDLFEGILTTAKGMYPDLLEMTFKVLSKICINSTVSSSGEHSAQQGYFETLSGGVLEGNRTRNRGPK